ncbi:hypothetical protein E2C01_046563 [Portunus trituberculatus]|uniref:Uncharacterized protein n=1 Tax=Portunus trituberculatus TaxID=210409 RepID=A0A5B7G563_PORTR|nr:hypothetical protein [Portunus trituberculatus]
MVASENSEGTHEINQHKLILYRHIHRRQYQHSNRKAGHASPPGRQATRRHHQQMFQEFETGTRLSTPQSRYTRGMCLSLYRLAVQFLEVAAEQEKCHTV